MVKQCRYTTVLMDPPLLLVTIVVTHVAVVDKSCCGDGNESSNTTSISGLVLVGLGVNTCSTGISNGNNSYNTRKSTIGCW